MEDVVLDEDLCKAFRRGAISLEDAWRFQANRWISGGKEALALEAIKKADKVGEEDCEMIEAG